MAYGGIYCSCGRRVKADAVIQHGFVMVRWEPVFVYLKYRCRHCGQVGEELVPCEEWEADILPRGEFADLTATEAEALEAALPDEGHAHEQGAAFGDTIEAGFSPDADEAVLVSQLRALTEDDWHELRNTI